MHSLETAELRSANNNNWTTTHAKHQQDQSKTRNAYVELHLSALQSSQAKYIGKNSHSILKATNSLSFSIKSFSETCIKKSSI